MPPVLMNNFLFTAEHCARYVRPFSPPIRPHANTLKQDTLGSWVPLASGANPDSTMAYVRMSCDCTTCCWRASFPPLCANSSGMTDGTFSTPSDDFEDCSAVRPGKRLWTRPQGPLNSEGSASRSMNDYGRNICDCFTTGLPFDVRGRSMFYFNARSVRSHHGFGAKSMMPYPRGRQHAGTMRPGRRKKPSSFIQGV